MKSCTTYLPTSNHLKTITNLRVHQHSSFSITLSQDRFHITRIQIGVKETCILRHNLTYNPHLKFLIHLKRPPSTPHLKLNQGPSNLINYNISCSSTFCWHVFYKKIFWKNLYMHLTYNSYRWDMVVLSWTAVSFIFLSRAFCSCQPHDNTAGVSGCHLYTAPTPQWIPSISYILL